jgi:hypothetical protein
MLVTSVATDTLSVTRGVGAAGAGLASSGAADTLVRISNASVEAQTLPAIRMTQPIATYNYSQIYRYPFGFSGTAQATRTYGGPLLDFERRKKGIEIKRDMEQTFWVGKRDIFTPGGAHPQRFMGGALSYIQTNVTTLTPPLTTASLEAFLRTVQRYNTDSTNMVAFCSPLVASLISAFPLGKLAPPSPAVSKWGVAITSYQSASGLQLPIVVKQDWNDLPAASPGLGGTMVVLNMDNVRMRQLQGRSIAVLENRQGNDEDARKDEWFLECSFQLIQESSHGVLRSVSS